MDTNYEMQQHHTLDLKDRKNLILSGVKSIESFDNEEFLVETALGFLLVTGKGLSLGKMDTENGDLIIKGIIESMTYVSGGNKSQKGKMMKRIFKWSP